MILGLEVFPFLLVTTEVKTIIEITISFDIYRWPRIDIKKINQKNMQFIDGSLFAKYVGSLRSEAGICWMGGWKKQSQLKTKHSLLRS